MKKLLSILLIILVLCGCSNKNDDASNNSVSGNSITSETQLERIIEDNNYIIVDVRTKEEYENSHLVGALNIPYNEIDENVDLDKAKDILVYCKSGGRSSIAKTTLESLGYTVYDLGGFDSIDLPKE